MTFAAFLATAWAEHGDRPGDVADRLAGAVGRIDTAEDAAAFARIVTHVYGEHLAQWHEGVAVLEKVHDRPACRGDPQAQAMLARHVATLRHGAGDAHALDGLSTDDRAAALATAAGAMAAQERWPRALADLDAALACAAAGLAAGSPAWRALAVAGNNLASALEEKHPRSPAETAGMVLAARTGVTYWRLAGTWLETERAYYRLARSLLRAGDVPAARDSAARCAALCAEHDAPALERFFAECVVAVGAREAGDVHASGVARERALAWYAAVAPEEQSWCAGDLAELGGAGQGQPPGALA